MMKEKEKEKDLYHALTYTIDTTTKTLKHSD